MAGSSIVRDVTIRAQTVGADAAARAALGLADAAQRVVVAEERVERQTRSTAGALETLQRRLDESYRNARLYEKAERDLASARNQNLISAQREQELLGLAAQRYGAMAGSASKAAGGVVAANENIARSTGLARHEMINLGRQAQDVATQLAMGQSPMSVLASQAAQIADIFMSTQGTMRGFLGQVAGGVGRFAMSGAGAATGGALIGAGAAYAAYQYADSQKAVENALRGVGAASGATVAGINRVAEAEAAAARVSVASAREILAAYAATGRVDPAGLPGLAGLTRNFAAFQSIGVDEATKQLASAFADPARGAEELAKRIGGLSDTSRQWIRSQQAAGDMLGAQRTLLATFSAQVDGAAERTGFFARMFDGLSRSTSNATNAVGKFIAGDSLEDQLAAAMKRREALVGGFDQTLAPDRSRLPALDAEIRRLQALVELERQRQAIDARAAQRDRSSLEAADVVGRYDRQLAQVQELAEARRKLNDELRLNPGGQRADEFRGWAEALETAERSVMSTSERQRQASDLTVRGIQARTLAERVAVEAARAQLEIAGQVVQLKDREAAVQQRIAELMAQANREAKDALRSSQDSLALAGLRPYQRRLAEAEFRHRDNRERFEAGTVAATGTAALPATAGVMRGMDKAFADNLQKLFAAVPGLGLTSGFRTYEQQARLYAEKGPGWAARPGTSRHESGLAADLNYRGSGQLPEWVREKAREFDIIFPLANRARNPEPWHAEPAGGRARQPATTGGVSSQILVNDRDTATIESFNSIVRAANDDLAAQQRQLEVTRSFFGRTTEEVARAQKFQELWSQAVREGGDELANKLRPELEQTAMGYGRLAAEAKAFDDMKRAMSDLESIGKDALKGFISDIRQGATAAEAFRNVINRVADKLIDMAINDLFGKAMGGGGGGGGIIGMIIRGFGGGSPYSAGAGGYTGEGPFLADGGYVKGPGGPRSDSIVARISNGEFVVNAAATSRHRDLLEQINRGGLHGFADGGFVSGRPPMPAANGNGPHAANVNVNVNNQTSTPARASARTEMQPDGSIDVIIDLVESRIAEKAAAGRSGLNDVFNRDMGKVGRG